MEEVKLTADEEAEASQIEREIAEMKAKVDTFGVDPKLSDCGNYRLVLVSEEEDGETVYSHKLVKKEGRS